MRTPCYERTGLRKGTWTPEEDRKLIDFVTRHGCRNWRQLPKFAGLSRCGKSCRLRWVNYLRPNVKRGNYTTEEEETILRLHESLGNKWSVIAAQFPGRTDNDVKNYWHSHLKKRVQEKKAMGMITDEDNNQRGKTILPNNESAQNFASSVENLKSTLFSSLIEESTTELAQSVTAKTSSDLIHQDKPDLWDSCSRDFWTEPFVLDNDYNRSNDHSHSSLVNPVEGLILPPQSPYLHQENLCHYYGFY